MQIAYRAEQRYLSRLVAQSDLKSTQAASDLPTTLAIDPQASYLITGGLGGLGLEAGRWLMSKGAKHLILIGRSAPSAKIEQQINQFQNAGTSVSVILTDINDQQRLKTLLASFTANAPIKGIIHAAGVVEDATLLQQTPAHFEKVMTPKLSGSWNLHQLSLDMPLDFFILFSSMTSMLGGLGQANYAAANAFMDQLAHYRRQRGLPALSINWAGWSEVGMAARMDETELKRLHQRGESLITPAQGKEILSVLLDQDAAQVGVLPVDWENYLAATRSKNNAFFEAVLNGKTAETKTAGSTTPQTRTIKWRQTLEETPSEQQRSALEDYLRQTLATILGLTDSHLIEARRGLRELGLDSILSIEVRGTLEDDLDCALPATLLFDYPTLEALSGYLADKVFQLKPITEPQTASDDISLIEDDDLTSLLADIDQISDADIQQQLTRIS